MKGLALRFGLVLLPACVLAQDSIVSGTHESQYVSEPGAHGVVEGYNWTQVFIDPNPTLRFVYTQLSTPTKFYQDETYLQITKDQRFLRIGRLRTAFGLSDWTEVAYRGFIYQPIIRYSKFGTDIYIGRLETGIQYSDLVGKIQIDASIVDPESTYTRKIIPNQFSYGSLKLQTWTGKVVYGASIYGPINNIYADDTKEKGLSVHALYNENRLKLRAEYIKGFDSTPSSNGWYVDGAYRLPRPWHRTEFVARTQSASLSGSSRINLQTVGVRQFIGENFQLTIGNTFGSSSPMVAWQKGWTGALLVQIPF
ncbi:MAG: hypothetical protein JSS72_00930 [Armatimonadetes bacterium]|nr:hypothetical protein [Armatimonadota bacterium]